MNNNHIKLLIFTYLSLHGNTTVKLGGQQEMPFDYFVNELKKIQAKKNSVGLHFLSMSQVADYFSM